VVWIGLAKMTHVSGPSHLFGNQAVVQYNIGSLSSGCEIPLTEQKNKDITTNQQKQQPKHEGFSVENTRKVLFPHHTFFDFLCAEGLQAFEGLA